MRVTHTLTMTALCPIDGTTDIYSVALEVDRLIPCEKIANELLGFRNTREYQEAITQQIADLFWPCAVTTAGTHKGVRTECSISA